MIKILGMKEKIQAPQLSLRRMKSVRRLAGRRQVSSRQQKCSLIFILFHILLMRTPECFSCAAMLCSSLAKKKRKKTKLPSALKRLVRTSDISFRAEIEK